MITAQEKRRYEYEKDRLAYTSSRVMGDGDRWAAMQAQQAACDWGGPGNTVYKVLPYLNVTM